MPRKANSKTRHGNGRGWGGPAKGGGRDPNWKPIGEPVLFDSETGAAMVRRKGDPLVVADRERREAVTAMLHGRMYDIAMDPAVPAQGAVAAAVALDNRINGMPVARTVNINSDAGEGLTPDERRARIDQLHAFITDGGGRDGTTAAADRGTSPPVPD